MQDHNDGKDLGNEVQLLQFTDKLKQNHSVNIESLLCWVWRCNVNRVPVLRYLSIQ